MAWSSLGDLILVENVGTVWVQCVYTSMGVSKKKCLCVCSVSNLLLYPMQVQPLLLVESGEQFCSP